MDTVTLTIDGRQVTVDKGKTVLQAAIESGVSVPYYCYHPGIGIDGSCRVCIVKIEKMPKLQTSCSTICTEGMVVSTRTPEVVEAKQLARRYRLPYIDLLPSDAPSPIDYEELAKIPVELMLRNHFVPLKRDGLDLHAAMADPTNLERLDELENALNVRNLDI